MTERRKKSRMIGDPATFKRKRGEGSGKAENGETRERRMKGGGGEREEQTRGGNPSAEGSARKTRNL